MKEVSMEEAPSKQLMFSSVVKVIGPRVSKVPKLIHIRLIW